MQFLRKYCRKHEIVDKGKEFHHPASVVGCCHGWQHPWNAVIHSQQLSPVFIIVLGRGVILTFSWGQIFYLFFNATWLLKNWNNKHFICSNLTLFIVPFFLFSLFFSFFSLFFFFSFSLGGGGRRPPSPPPPNEASGSRASGWQMRSSLCRFVSNRFW